MEDIQILELFFARSETAIQETDQKYGRYCYKIAFGILENREDSEESVSDTYYSAWNAIPPKKPARLSTYLDAGKCYQAGNFQISMELYMPQKKGEWPYAVQALLRYCRKDVLSPDFAYLNKDESWKQWNYRSASGKNILILRAPEGEAYLFCDCGEATLTLSFESGDNPDTDMTDYPFTWMTDEQVEKIADAIDFTVSPRLPEETIGKPASHPKGWEIETKSVDFDGCFGRIVFHLTAPWETKLLYGDAGYVYPENSNLLIPEISSFDMKSWVVASEALWETGSTSQGIAYWIAEKPIDLDRVKSIRFEDGTEIVVEGKAEE